MTRTIYQKERPQENKQAQAIQKAHGSDRPTWQVRISLTQAPHPYQQDLLTRDYEEEWQESDPWRSFLYDPMIREPPRTYGLELEAGRSFKATFRANASSEGEAWQLGRSWLASLRYKFLGLDGTLEVLPLTAHLTSRNSNIQFNDKGGDIASVTNENHKASTQGKLYEICIKTLIKL